MRRESTVAVRLTLLAVRDLAWSWEVRETISHGSHATKRCASKPKDGPWKGSAKQAVAYEQRSADARRYVAMESYDEARSHLIQALPHCGLSWW